MQAQDLFPQVQKLALSEQLALLNFLVQLIQQEVVPEAQSQETVLERMGGMPQYSLSEGHLSDRDSRRKVLSERIHTKYHNQR
jgi:hypothetical protein